MSKEKLEQENREYDTQIKNLNKEMEQMRKDLVDVQKLNRDNNRRFSQLSKQINTMQKDINSYNKSISNREEGYDDLAKQEVSLVTKLEKKKMQFDSLEKQIAENKKKMEDLEKEIEQYKNKNASMKKNNRELSRNIDNLQDENYKLKETNNSLETRKTNITQKINKHLNENAKLTVLTEKLNKEIEILTQQSKEYQEENTRMSDELNTLKDTKLIQNNDITQFHRDLKKLKKSINAVSNISDEYKELYDNVLQFYNQFEELILQLKLIRDKPNNINIAKKSVQDLGEEIKNLNSQYMIIKQENLMIEQEIRILKELKVKMSKELENIKSLKQKNEILINHNLQENVKSKDEFLDIICEEMALLRDIRIENDAIDDNTQQKVVEILKMIKEEKDLKIDLGAQNEEQQANEQSQPMNQNVSVISNDTNNKKSLNNSLFIGNDSIISENIYNNPQGEYTGNYTPKNNIRKKRRGSRFAMKNSASLRYHNLKYSQAGDNSTIRSRNTSMDHNSFNHLYKQENYYEESELKLNWKVIMRGFTKIISFFLKSSSLMVNSISAVINKHLKTNRPFQKVRQQIIK